MHDLRAREPAFESRFLAALARVGRRYRTTRTPPSHVLRLEELGVTDRANWLASAARYNEARTVERYLKARERVNPRYPSLFQHTLHSDFLAARSVRQPTLMLFWHCGIMRSTFSALSGLGPDVTLIKSGKVYAAQSAQLDLLITDESPSSSAIGNARLLKKAAGKLRAGGIVATFLDGTNGTSTSNVRFFGQSISLRGSIESLVGRSDARVFPCVSRWSTGDRRLELLVGPDLRHGRREAIGVLQAATDWFADHLTTHLGDLTPASLHLLTHDCSRNQRGDHVALSTQRY